VIGVEEISNVLADFRLNGFGRLSNVNQNYSEQVRARIDVENGV
jgi:hypothetical protein